PNGQTAYVTNYESNTVTPITTATNTAGKPIKVGSRPSGIAITPDGKTAYVVDGVDHPGWGTVTPITTATNTAGKLIRVGGSPQTIAMTPDGKTAYVIGGTTTNPTTKRTHHPGTP